MVAPVTRRALLGGAALVLAGCGDDGGEPRLAFEEAGGDSTLADVALLNDALANERRAAEVLPRSAANAARLEREIARLRGRPRPLAGDAPPPPDPIAAAQELVALYIDMLPKLAEPRLRGLAGELIAAASGAIAELRAERGEHPAPEAFVAGRA